MHALSPARPASRDQSLRLASGAIVVALLIGVAAAFAAPSPRIGAAALAGQVAGGTVERAIADLEHWVLGDVEVSISAPVETLDPAAARSGVEERRRIVDPVVRAQAELDGWAIPVSPVAPAAPRDALAVTGSTGDANHSEIVDPVARGQAVLDGWAIR